VSEWIERGGDPLEIESENYGVRFYRRDPHRLVTIFASAGARRVNGFSEEFRSTFWPTGVSLMFVTDRRLFWYNHFETERLFQRLAEIAGGFTHHACIGESMGACGSILFTNYATHTDRVVAFSPQYSILQPYVAFDSGYAHISEQITFPVNEDFSRTPMKSRVVLIYGNRVWRDYLHGSMYVAAGFVRLVIDDAPHEVASHLKTTYDVDALRRLGALLTDFETEFTSLSLPKQLDVRWTDRLLQDRDRFGREYAEQCRFHRALSDPKPIPPIARRLISEGCKATQSSLSEWSIGADPASDAQGALDGKIGPNHHFHTAFETRPWWQVDLGRVREVEEIRIFNRIDNYFPAARAFDFRIEISPDGVNWTCVVDRNDHQGFGGADGRPFIFLADPSFRTRLVRISLNNPGHLHLNQVQIFGRDD
jgi:hypothetical protein